MSLNLEWGNKMIKMKYCDNFVFCLIIDMCVVAYTGFHQFRKWKNLKKKKNENEKILNSQHSKETSALEASR